MTNNFDTLADRIRDEAAQASRSGQMARLEAIAEEVERLRRGAKTLGHTVEQQGRMALDASGMHHVIGEDGDGDWAVVWESLYDLRGKADRSAAAIARVEALLETWDDDTLGRHICWPAVPKIRAAIAAEED